MFRFIPGVRKNLFGSKRQFHNEKFSRGYKVETSKEGSKKYFCVFCKKLTTKFARHLCLVHKDMPEVQEILFFDKGSSERLRLIEELRKKGTFEYNCSTHYNSNKQLLVSRRPQAVKQRTDAHYECCSNCKSFFSKLTLRHHFRKCMENSSKGKKDIMQSGRKARMHLLDIASPVLCEEIFPVLRDDEVSNALQQDKLLIIFGNKLVKKYRAKYHHKEIRSKLRSLGRLLLAMKEKTHEIRSFASIYNSRFYDLTIKTVNELGGLNEHTGCYRAPSYPYMIGILLKQIGKILISECVKDQNKNLKTNVEDFLHLLQEDYGTSVNKTVLENQLEKKRNKANDIPNLEDIQIFKKYLDENRAKYFKILKEKFSFCAWKALAMYTLTTLQLFNRRRAGEIQRILITDVEKSHGIRDGTNDDLYNSLTATGKQTADQYIRCVIRGKLARGVPVLFHKSHWECIKLIIEHRNKTGVSSNNPYVFGIPSASNEFQFLDACSLMREFSYKCGAKNPESLRGTKLRKHIATQSVILNLNETDVTDLASFMGHAEKIHKDHYRMPLPVREITKISKLLELVQGDSVPDSEKSGQMNTSNTIASTSLISEGENDQNLCKVQEIESTASTSSLKVNGTEDETFEQDIFDDDSLQHIEEPYQWSPSSYRPTSEEDSSVNGTPKKKIGNKKSTWNTPERQTARKYLNNFIEEKKLPSLKLCNKIVKSYMPNRTAKQLKAWISNQIKKTNSVSTPKKSYVKRITWLTPEKAIVKKEFRDCFQTRVLPSLQRCSEVIAKYPILRKRNSTILKAQVNNEIQRRKKLGINEGSS